MQPAATNEEASRIALLMAGRAEPDLADAVAKLAFWRATRNRQDSTLPRELGDALAYSAFLDLVILSGQTALADPEDGPWVLDIEASGDG
ncbi:MAG: hypothetical protein MUC58_12590 [Rhizobiaceae bacterium]|nr:hypothetical protein [Rhizobiaceae bacterium]